MLSEHAVRGNSYLVKVATTEALSSSQITFISPDTSYLEFIFCTVSGPLVIDTIPILLGDRILLKDQINAIFNGIYEAIKVDTTSSPPPHKYTFRRPKDTLVLNAGTYICSQMGFENGGKIFILDFLENNFTIGFHEIIFK